MNALRHGYESDSKQNHQFLPVSWRSLQKYGLHWTSTSSVFAFKHWSMSSVWAKYFMLWLISPKHLLALFSAPVFLCVGEPVGFFSPLWRGDFILLKVFQKRCSWPDCIDGFTKVPLMVLSWWHYWTSSNFKAKLFWEVFLPGQLLRFRSLTLPVALCFCRRVWTARLEMSPLKKNDWCRMITLCLAAATRGWLKTQVSSCKALRKRSCPFLMCYFLHVCHT